MPIAALKYLSMDLERGFHYRQMGRGGVQPHFKVLAATTATTTTCCWGAPQNDRSVFLRTDAELVGAAKALRKEIEEIEKDTKVEKRFKKLLFSQISEVDKKINEMTKAREDKIEDEQRKLAAVNGRKNGPKK
jgi:hypothetical protein